MKKIYYLATLSAILCLPTLCNAEEAIWSHHGRGDRVLHDAADVPGSDAPDRSTDFSGIEFTGRFANYTKGDTWYPSWASDGNLYSPWTDGSVGQTVSKGWTGKSATWGYATITGDDPLDLRVKDYGVRPGSASPYGGRYPCGSLHYNGVWYHGTYALDQSVNEVRKKFGWYNMGPFLGFAISEDNGKTWTDSPHSPSAPLFDEPERHELDLAEGKDGPFIKMGAPHFVDFGKNMEHSPDGKAYLVGHGAEHPDPQPRIANNSWVTGDAAYLARVAPSLANMNDASKYEFFSGHDAEGNAQWTRDFKKIKPIFSWNNRFGIVTITYNAPLKKYFMCVTDGHRETTSRRHYTSYILESDQLTGPWNIVAYMPDFGPQAYFLNIPSKFISDDGKTMWLCFSANYMASGRRNDPEYLEQTTPKGSAYALSLHEFEIRGAE
ncbi:MAG: hypothetical protein AAGH99_14500 [Planctomycetota bacterium]